MARVNVDQRALSDPRFQILANLTGLTRQHVLGCMVEVWNECQERGSYQLSGDTIFAIFDVPDIWRKMTLAELCEDVGEGMFRIKGTKGRIEWLRKRRNDGQKGGRPRKTLGLYKKHPGNNPPAPAPAPAQEQTTLVRSASPKRTARSPLNPQDDPELLAMFDKLYTYYPRHVGREAAWRAFRKLNPDLDTCKAIALNIKARVDSGSWVPDDPERSRFIPHLASFLNQRRWQDEDVA